MAKRIEAPALTASGSPRLTFREKFSFGIGDTMGTFGTSVIGLFYLKYLTDIIGVGAALAGVVMLVTQLYTAVSDPFIGQLSDSTHTRWGRRRFYILFFTIPTGIAYYFLWAIPRVHAGNDNIALITVIAILASVVYFTFFTLVTVPYSTLTMEMTDAYDERSRLTTYRMFVSIIGGLIAIALPYIIVPDMAQDRSNFQDVYGGFLTTGVIIAVIIGTIPLITYFGCKERGSYRPVPGGLKVMVATYRTMWKNRPFRNATFSYMFTWGGFMVMQSFFQFYLESYMRITNMWIMLSIVILLFVAAAGFLPVWLYLMQRIGKKASYNIGMGALALCSMLIMLIQPGQLVLVYVLVFLMSFGVSAAHVVPMSIIPDTIDISRLQTGYDSEGLYYGFQAFMQKAATAGFTGLAGVALGWAGYIKLEDLPVGQSQPEPAIWAIRILFSAIPAVFMGIGVIFMYFMKLDRKSHERTIQSLQSRSGAGNG